MENKSSSSGKYILIVASAAVAVILGGLIMVHAFFDAYEGLAKEHNAHLTDIAWSTDRNIADLFLHANEDLSYYVENGAEIERTYLASGDAAAMLDYFRSLPLTKPDYISAVLILQDNDVLLCTHCGERCSCVFPYGINLKAPCICMNESGTAYLALVTQSPNSNLCYALLIDLQNFYRQVAGTELTSNYWLTLYDESTGLFLQNDEQQPDSKIISVEEALAREDGVSILVTGETQQRLLTQPYSYQYSDGSITRNLMSVIPTAINGNGVFAVGVALSSEHVISILQHTFRQLTIFVLLFLSGLTVLLVLISRNRRSNKAMRERVALLEQENQAMQDLAHHQRLELIGTMTSGIAHEFNNLLTPIMGYSILSMEQLPEDSDQVLENLSEIYDASKRAKTLITRLSSLSRKNSGDTKRLFSPDRLSDKVLDMAQPSLPPMVTVVRDYHCPQECLFADETQIGQLLLNLVINAFQAMKRSGGTLTISTQLENGTVLFRVCDTGPGITPEVFPQLFDPFFTTKENGRGTGLGLAIARQIAENHNGTVTVKSEAGQGTVFIVSLPAQAE